tara:strand:- start:2777 stop:3406 length:630 start_codon:yes stop_codon:yes gene_type:complete
MYSITWTANPSMAITQVLKMYIPLGSFVDNNTLNGNYIFCRFQGRTTNHTRMVTAIPTVSGSFDNPIYEYNSRYWLVQVDVLFGYGANAVVNRGSVYGNDNMSTKRAGKVVLQSNFEIYDVTFFYRDTNVLEQSQMTEIGANTTFQVRSTPDYVGTTYPFTRNVVPFYNEYTDNDMIDISTGAKGVPPSADEDLQNAIYGIETWYPNDY